MNINTAIFILAYFFLCLLGIFLGIFLSLLSVTIAIRSSPDMPKPYDSEKAHEITLNTTEDIENFSLN
jgi:MFS superfamily sulfate permease-like transporter